MGFPVLLEQWVPQFKVRSFGSLENSRLMGLKINLMLITPSYLWPGSLGPGLSSWLSSGVSNHSPGNWPFSSTDPCGTPVNGPPAGHMTLGGAAVWFKGSSSVPGTPLS